MPVFGGTRGQEWENNLQDLKKMFDKHLDGIKNLDYDILDVKITKWHDDYGQMFKDQIKNIEVIYATIIQMTLRHVSTVEDGVEMLENFYQLAKRPTIIDHVQKKGAEQVYQLFTAEIKEVENMFESQHKKRPPMPVSWSHYGGIAIWVLTKISNQINQRCRQKINKDEMLGDDVEKCMMDLDESIACCQQWKEICTRMQYMIKTYSKEAKHRPWVLD